jgi:hypothetical protein
LICRQGKQHLKCHSSWYYKNIELKLNQLEAVNKPVDTWRFSNGNNQTRPLCHCNGSNVCIALLLCSSPLCLFCHWSYQTTSVWSCPIHESFAQINLKNLLCFSLCFSHFIYSLIYILYSNLNLVYRLYSLSSSFLPKWELLTSLVFAKT